MHNDLPYVGEGAPDNGFRSREAIAVFETAPGKAERARLVAKAPKGSKLTFRGRLASLTLKRTYLSKENSVVAFLEAADGICPLSLAFREVTGFDRTRTSAHLAALSAAEALLPALEADVAATSNTIGRRLATGLLMELSLADPTRAFSSPQKALLSPALEELATMRRREFSHTLANCPDELMEALPTIVWDARDAVADLEQIAGRLSMWAALLDGVRLEAAVWLGARVAEANVDGTEQTPRELGDALWVAWKAARQTKSSHARKLRTLVKEYGGAAQPSLVLGDLRRAVDDRGLVKLAEAVLTLGPADWTAAADWMARRDTALALELYERAATAAEPTWSGYWHVVNNGIAMLLACDDGPLRPTIAKRWSRRAEPLTQAPLRHNYACLLARRGRPPDEVMVPLLEAIRGGAELDPIVTDRELVAVLRLEEVRAALDEREPALGPRQRLEALRWLTLGEVDRAMSAAIEAAKNGADPDEIKSGSAFVALHAHPDLKRVRRPSKRR